MKPDHSGFLDLYARELLWWNSGMNLLSRRAPEETCRNLLQQCESAAELLWRWMKTSGSVDPEASLVYADLGSGAGFPGVVWSRYFSDQAGKVQTLLVEPREKRAWFLRRVSGLEGAPPFRVFRGRWGDRGAGVEIGQEPAVVLISLKALRLNDFQVLSGIPAGLGVKPNLAGGLGEVVIVRFYPPEQKLDSGLDASLGLGKQDFLSVLASGMPEFRGRTILGPTKGLLPASLVVTRYAGISR